MSRTLTTRWRGAARRGAVEEVSAALLTSKWLFAGLAGCNLIDTRFWCAYLDARQFGIDKRSAGVEFFWTDRIGAENTTNTHAIERSHTGRPALADTIKEIEAAPQARGTEWAPKSRYPVPSAKN